MRDFTKRYIIQSIDGLNLSKPIKYERYYINDKLRVQKKNAEYEKECLDNENNIVEKKKISEKEFLEFKGKAYSEIIRESYLYLDDNRVSIKKYFGRYLGLLRVEVSFNSVDEEKDYVKESWMGQDITNSPLAFDKYLSKLSDDEFREELNKYIY